MSLVIIEPTPQHDEILAALYFLFGNADDVVINNNERSNGSVLPSHVSLKNYSFSKAARAVLAKNCDRVWFSTVETPSAAALLLIAGLFRRKIFFVAHHAEIFGPVSLKPARHQNLKRQLFSLLFGRWARYLGKIYVLSSDVAHNCRYDVEVLDLEGLFVNESFGDVCCEADNCNDDSSHSRSYRRLSIGVLGSVNSRRRCYEAFLYLDPKWCNSENVLFRLIGNINMWEGRQFISRLRDAGLSDCFWWSEGKLSNEDFFKEVRNLDAIVAPYAIKDYGRTVTSASKVFARAFSKPLLEGFDNFHLVNSEGKVILESLGSLQDGLRQLVFHLRDSGI